ncbi:hypothetical protein B0H66DRAFT_526946 [Apodospora peruviana]|uniref:t-SNARE coiled-coil homology domain-containing protein n=1 Tax=Apodospora peruviana TaxID=516989 RepID=A0AAE0IRC3_9PEZI|nr:hypothetical protein B0H66DRAFT_526946 [Apodospora peruviana]
MSISEMSEVSVQDEEKQRAIIMATAKKKEGGCVRFRWARKLFSNMRKIFGKKPKEEDASSVASFGRDRPTPQNNNPYAQQPAADPYTNSQSSFRPPQQGFASGSRQGLPSGIRPGLPSGPRSGGPARQQPPPPEYGDELPPYQGGSNVKPGYRDEKAGTPGGWGGDNANAASYNARYSGSSTISAPRIPSQRPGGYGNLGSVDSDSPSKAPPGYSPHIPQTGGQRLPPGQSSDDFDGYGAREHMTAEEQENWDVQDQKNQILHTQGESKQSLVRSNAAMNQAIETATGSVSMLREQRGKLNNIELKVDQAQSLGRQGGEGTNKLKRLNDTPFFLPSGVNGNGKKGREADHARLAHELLEKETREETRRNAFQNEQRLLNANRDAQKPKALGLGNSNRSKYVFEDDDGQMNENEDQIDELTSQLAAGVGTLHSLALDIQDELDVDPDQLKRLAEKTDRVDETVRRNRLKLDKIR